jgi:hypothetical protein
MCSHRYPKPSATLPTTAIKHFREAKPPRVGAAPIRRALAISKFAALCFQLR